MDRRAFLRSASQGMMALPLLPAFSASILRAGETVPAASEGRWDRILVMVELKGGNDGLNTVVPHGDDAYYRLRPRLGIPKDTVLPLGDSTGLHPAMKPMLETWEQGELAIVQGLGYENPNRSHFRSIEIWETGSDSDEFLQQGWIARMFQAHTRPSERAADGVIVGREDQGPLLGTHMRNVVIDNPEQFVKRAGELDGLPRHEINDALAHILEVHRDIRRAGHVIEEKRRSAPDLGVDFPGTRLARQLRVAADLIVSEIPLSVIKVSLTGFDTHSNQRGAHQRLLGELSGALDAFRKALVKHGAWDRTMVMTYSEFGRRAAENGSRGTDHGTAAPHFILGGKVRGGIHGKHPSLTQLRRGGDLRHTVEYRNLYATVAKDWWELSGEPFDGYKTLGIVAKSAPAKSDGKPKAEGRTGKL